MRFVSKNSLLMDLLNINNKSVLNKYYVKTPCEKVCPGIMPPISATKQ